MKKRYGLRFSVASVLLAASVAFSSVVMASADTKEIAPGVKYEKFSQDGTNFNTIEFKPGGKLKIVGGMSNGYVWGTQNVLGMAQDVENDPEIEGEVIAAMNGDFFTMSTSGNPRANDYGVPYSAFISGGKILAGYNHVWGGSINRIAVGVKADGTAVYGTNPAMTITGKVNGSTELDITYINRARPHDGVTDTGYIWPVDQLILYTPDYYSSTKTNAGGVEVKVKVSEMDVCHGGKIVGVVEGSPSTAGDMEIGEGYVVLSAMNGKKDDLQSLKDGDQIEISISINDPDWQDVQFAIGGSVIAAEDGELSRYIDDPNDNYNASRSRTQVGIKEDGTMVWMTADEAGGSSGLTLREMTETMLERGCVTVINLDGGGSTQFIGRNDDDTLSVWNTPMDGVDNARHVANGIVLVYDENAEDLTSSVLSSSSSETSDVSSQTSGGGTVSTSSIASTPASTANPGTGDGGARMMLFVAAAMIVLSGGFIVVNLVDYKQKRKSDK